MARVAIVGVLLTALVVTASAQAPAPAYVAIGDSIEFGLGDNILGDGFGYVPLVGAFLTSFFGQPVQTSNFGEPFALARDVRQVQLRAAVAAAQGHAPVVVSWGGGGFDLIDLGTGPQAAACRQSQSCLGRFNGLLNEVEQTIDLTIRQLRAALGSQAVILMRTQYHALKKTGCATPEVVALAAATLEGAPGTVLDRGLNQRIREVAAKHHAQVVELFPPFFAAADALVAADCAHPSGTGHQVISMLSSAAFLAAQ
jgi:lysophospholipase L1-like esterase